MDYVLTTDNRQLEIPAVDNETFSDSLEDPIRTVDDTLIYATDSGGREICEKTTVGKSDSDLKYRELHGYLKGRGGQVETIYLDRLKSTITGYIRIVNADSLFKGNHGTRRKLSVKIMEA